MMRFYTCMIKHLKQISQLALIVCKTAAKFFMILLPINFQGFTKKMMDISARPRNPRKH